MQVRPFSFFFHIMVVQIQGPRTRPSPTLRKCGRNVPRPHPRWQNARLGPLWWDAQDREPEGMAKMEMQLLTGV